MGCTQARRAVGHDRPFLVDLVDGAALRSELVGAKAAALARAGRAGLPVLPGFVVTTVAPPVAGTDPERDGLAAAWRWLSVAGTRPLVVRSSSTVEDGSTTSMAGLFVSVVDVRGWADFLEAVDAVQASANVVSLPHGDATMAVLVQPHLDPAWGGVLFGADPITGRRDRLVVVSTAGGPQGLVGGTVDGSHFSMDRNGRLRSSPAGDDAPLGGRQRRALARLARRAAAAMGGPQDIEWAIDDRGTTWLLQARPITAVGRAADARGPILGPGPVAETLPGVLAPLEQDLWVSPLRAAVAESLALTGAASRRALAASPPVVVVGSRVAANLEMLGVARPRRRPLARLDPRPGGRRLRAAWRVGRLRSALPLLARDLVERCDAELAAVPAPASLPTAALLGALRRSHQVLVALHGHEVLVGLLLPATATDTVTTSASVALRALVSGRAQGRTDADIVATSPVVLALAPPAIATAVTLPPTTIPAVPGPDDLMGFAHDDLSGDSLAVVREALRLRARWTQELTARVALELGRRLVAAGLLAAADDVRLLHLDELEQALRGRHLPADLGARAAVVAPPLPAAFRLTADGAVVADAGTVEAGRPAGGGRGRGRVHDGIGQPPPGSVLVVATLPPSLAPLLPGLSGLVAETGSVLSHLAILARELGVPTVVGARGALDRFPPGTDVVVDGTTGEVTVVVDERPGAA